MNSFYWDVKFAVFGTTSNDVHSPYKYRSLCLFALSIHYAPSCSCLRRPCWIPPYHLAEYLRTFHALSGNQSNKIIVRFAKTTRRIEIQHFFMVLDHFHPFPSVYYCLFVRHVLLFHATWTWHDMMAWHDSSQPDDGTYNGGMVGGDRGKLNWKILFPSQKCVSRTLCAKFGPFLWKYCEECSKKFETVMQIFYIMGTTNTIKLNLRTSVMHIYNFKAAILIFLIFFKIVTIFSPCCP